MRMCSKGLHDMDDPANPPIDRRDSWGKRCRKCENLRSAKYRARRKAAGVEQPTHGRLSSLHGRPGDPNRSKPRLTAHLLEAVDLWTQYPDPRTSAEPRPAWMEEANCASSDPDIFYPPEEPDIAQARINIALAKAVCEPCPVRSECLKYAIRHAERQGVWGGTSRGERMRARLIAGLGPLPEPIYYEPVRPQIEEVPLEEWDAWERRVS